MTWSLARTCVGDVAKDSRKIARLGVMTKRHVFGTDYRADFRFYTVTPLIPT